jgi:hypothetical protein
MSEIERFHTGATITAGSSAATTTPRFPFGRYAGGGVLIGSTNGATQIVTVGAHPIPDACFGFAYVAPVVVGATTCAMTVSVKG